VFADRTDAGRKLAGALLKYRDEKPVVLALPRGGVPVAYEVAKALDAQLDVIVVRKLGAPFQPELGIGALVDGDQPQSVFNEELIRALNVSREFLAREVELELEEIHRRQELYRRGHPAVDYAGRTVIVVDDGIATGGSAAAALRSVRRAGAAKVVLAVPVALPQTLDRLRGEVDEVVCLAAPDEFFAIGQFYDDFSQTSDQQVINLLDLARISVRYEVRCDTRLRPMLGPRS
jgi:putative phosphoribosyl transferase